MSTKLFLMFSSDILPKYECITSIIFSRNSNTMAALTFCLVTAANQILARCNYINITGYIQLNHVKIYVKKSNLTHTQHSTLDAIQFQLYLIWEKRENQVKNTYFDMKETGARYIGDGRSHLLPSMDDIHTKRIHCISSDIISIYARNEHFTFVIIHKKTTNHCCPLVSSLCQLDGISYKYSLYLWVPCQTDRHIHINTHSKTKFNGKKINLIFCCFFFIDRLTVTQCDPFGTADITTRMRKIAQKNQIAYRSLLEKYR